MDRDENAAKNICMAGRAGTYACGVLTPTNKVSLAS